MSFDCYYKLLGYPVSKNIHCGLLEKVPLKTVGIVALGVAALTGLALYYRSKKNVMFFKNLEEARINKPLKIAVIKQENNSFLAENIRDLIKTINPKGETLLIEDDSKPPRINPNCDLAIAVPFKTKIDNSQTKEFWKIREAQRPILSSEAKERVKNMEVGIGGLGLFFNEELRKYVNENIGSSFTKTTILSHLDNELLKGIFVKDKKPKIRDMCAYNLNNHLYLGCTKSLKAAVDFILCVVAKEYESLPVEEEHSEEESSEEETEKEAEALKVNKDIIKRVLDMSADGPQHKSKRVENKKFAKDYRRSKLTGKERRNIDIVFSDHRMFNSYDLSCVANDCDPSEILRDALAKHSETLRKMKILDVVIFDGENQSHLMKRQKGKEKLKDNEIYGKTLRIILPSQISHSDQILLLKASEPYTCVCDNSSFSNAISAKKIISYENGGFNIAKRTLLGRYAIALDGLDTCNYKKIGELLKNPQLVFEFGNLSDQLYRSQNFALNLANELLKFSLRV